MKTRQTYHSITKWRADVKVLGARPKLTTRWRDGGGHWVALHPTHGIVGFYNKGITGRHRYNAGSLTRGGSYKFAHYLTDKVWPRGILKRVSRDAYNAVTRARGFDFMSPAEREVAARRYDKLFGHKPS